VTARAAPQVLRIAELFAALERTNQIGPKHLEAALAIWDYADRTCQWIFGSILGDQHADDILLGLRSAGAMTRTQISEFLGKHVNKAAIERALRILLAANLVQVEKSSTAGRSAEVWQAR
jgi:hypothetical protein